MDGINYQHLRYFWYVAREGSVSGAARRLRLSPSTVSTQIKALEDHLGRRLLERRGRGRPRKKAKARTVSTGGRS